MGLDPETAGSRPGPKAGAKPLSHPRDPQHNRVLCCFCLNTSYLTCRWAPAYNGSTYFLTSGFSRDSTLDSEVWSFPGLALRRPAPSCDAGWPQQGSAPGRHAVTEVSHLHTCNRSVPLEPLCFPFRAAFHRLHGIFKPLLETGFPLDTFARR